MERKIVKTGIYSFILGLLVGLFVFKGYTVDHYSSSSYTIYYDSLDQYIFQLLRFSAACSLLAILIAGFDQQNELIASDRPAIRFLKLICVACCVVIASYWIVIGLY